MIKEHATQLDNWFSYEQITYEDNDKEIKKLDYTKAFQDTDVPSRQYPIVNSQQVLKMPMFYQSIKNIES